jgi:hypothetical protein
LLKYIPERNQIGLRKERDNVSRDGGQDRQKDVATDLIKNFGNRSVQDRMDEEMEHDAVVTSNSKAVQISQ